MAPKSSYLIGGLAMASVMIVALPAASGTGAASKAAPIIQVNRAAKGDRIVEPRTIAVKKPGFEAPRQPASTEQSDKRKIMDGCEPAFSPVTMPSMAHIAGRCVG